MVFIYTHIYIYIYGLASSSTADDADDGLLRPCVYMVVVVDRFLLYLRKPPKHDGGIVNRLLMI